MFSIETTKTMPRHTAWAAILFCSQLPHRAALQCQIDGSKASIATGALELDIPQLD